MKYTDVKIEDLLGKVVRRYEVTDEELRLWTDDHEYLMSHQQECCEQVYLDDVIGDLDDLVGEPVLVAVEESSREDPTPEHPAFAPYIVATALLNRSAAHKDVDWFESGLYDRDYHTWTFYKIDTRKGGVTLRWWGSSNGYYSESVDIIRRDLRKEDGQ